ncbi:MAG: hypothetical protein COT16_03115 [Elusimicrobia bacterium CG08_land_8_20_14_0_20_44_26]|nr:MAG: hypothetical protein COT16_03115 [Elusimicrobia bacterium CG08_land_8_20_14_0_20_44_26]
MRKHKNILTGLLVSLAFFSSSCGRKGGSDTAVESSVEVKLYALSRGDIEETVPLTGSIRGEKEVKVYAKVTGKLVEKIKEEGDRLKENEAFALIDRDEAALNYSKAQVISPIDGILTMYYCDIGDAVFPSPGAPIAMIAQMDKVKAVAYLSEVDMGAVKKGQEVRIKSDAYPDEIFTGKVTTVASAANPLTRKIKVEVTVPNNRYLLKPGTFARLDIITGIRKNVLLVNSKAVAANKNEKYVFVVENGSAKMRTVSCGISSGELVEIKTGLEDGEKVIVQGNYGLIEGTKVKEENEK